MIGRSEMMNILHARALKKWALGCGLHNAHNLNWEFCKFCAQELEMIGFIFLSRKESSSGKQLNQDGNIFYKL
jgi:hypothetical protein